MQSIQDLLLVRKDTGEYRSSIIVLGDIAKIVLPCGNFAIIDASKAADAKLFAWAYHGTRRNNFYVKSCNWLGEGKKRSFMLHHLILPRKNGMLTDHIDGNTLNNKAQNLRYVTRRQNGLNQLTRKPNKPVGMSYDKKKGWRVRVNIDGKNRHVGWFRSKDDAMICAREIHLKTHGEFSVYLRPGVNW